MRNANQDPIFHGCHMGTVNYYKTLSPAVIYTDGVKIAAEKLDAYWLIDLIVSHQYNPAVRNTPFQHWKLERVAGDKFVAICEDGNDGEVTRQEIEYSDFPFDIFSLWLTNGILLLPAEY